MGAAIRSAHHQTFIGGYPTHKYIAADAYACQATDVHNIAISILNYNVLFISILNSLLCSYLDGIKTIIIKDSTTID